MKISLFKNSFASEPSGTLTLEQLIDHIREGSWQKMVERVRKLKGTQAYKKTKTTLPGVTISADLKSRDVKRPIEERLKSHTGLICLDIDRKDNPKLKVDRLIDKDSLAQYVSLSGEGLKIIYKCEPTTEPAKHRRIYDACVQRLEKIGVKIKVDPIVKSIGSLQYVSYDPNAFYNPKTTLTIKPLPPVKRATIIRSAQVEGIVAQLEDYVAKLGKKDITSNYEDWLNVLFGLSHTLGDAGRPIMHDLCKNYKGYSVIECDEKYDAILESGQHTQTPITVSTVFQIINDHLPKPIVKQLVKKYNKQHATEKNEAGTGVDYPELAGYVAYGLFLFEKHVDKKTQEVIDLTPKTLNLNAFEKLLTELGFYRYDEVDKGRKWFVRIVNNIVKAVDVHDILKIVTEYIEQSGDYRFIYQGTEFPFSWEEIAHRWRQLRAQSSMQNQIQASLSHWVPNLLKDTSTESYVPYRNGVAIVNAKGVVVQPYYKIGAQIWEDRIIQRDFKIDRTMGMFEEFFANVMGRGPNVKNRRRSKEFNRARWYYGYMLQGTKRQSTARAWILYDINAGNSGRSGKTIIGTAVGQIRSVVVIDGKRIDLNDRFAFQTVQPWTDVIFIDDPSKYTSIVPLFNMISGTTIADRKTISPIVKDLKIMFASNWILEAQGSSEAGRQFVSQLSDHYIKIAKEKKTLQPIVDTHGKEFYTDWDEKDWNRFDTFSLECLRYHLSGHTPDNEIIGNSAILRFIQIHEEELFHALRRSLDEYARPIKGGGFSVVHGILTDVVAEYVPDNKVRKGRIVREFFAAIGAGDVRISSDRVGGKVQGTYVSSVSLETLTK